MTEIIGIKIEDTKKDPASIKAYLQYKDHHGTQYVLPMMVGALAELIQMANQMAEGLPPA